MAVHKDGRISVAATGDGKAGLIGAVGPGDDRMRVIVPRSAGFVPNDLVFDAKGGFYSTDFRGSTTQPDGGVYYVSPDFKTITPIMRHLAKANGVAMSPNGKRLWVGEFAANRLIRIDLATATTLTPLGGTVAYNFIGPAPDSVRTDAEGNLYVALHGQGRVIAFSPDGIPIGQILLPGRQQLRLTFHDLRGTVVTRLAIAGCTIPQIATITGHSLRDVETILDAHYLMRDSGLGETAISKLESGANCKPDCKPRPDGSAPEGADAN